MIVRVAETSQVSAARRVATQLAEGAQFDEQKTGQVALVATEMATNLIKHGGGGEIVVTPFADMSGSGIEILALDKGNGIRDLDAALKDGFSTSGTQGSGLGAIQRQSSFFQVFSKPNGGTAIVARILGAPPKADPTRQGVLLGSVLAPYPGETICGDAWSYGDTPSGPTLLVADGSGHGALAERASSVAVEAFRANITESGPRLIEILHKALAPTRGGAIAIARIDRAERVLRFIGVGNIAGALITGGETKHMVSHNGTAGHVAPRIREFTYPYTSAPTVVLHSDGLTTKWNLAAYPGLAVAHPSLLAGVLYRDHARGRDDISVVAMQAAA